MAPLGGESGVWSSGADGSNPLSADGLARTVTTWQGRGMKLLMLGGTAWVGHEVATQALALGHDVTCLSRSGGVPPGATWVEADRDHADALSAVSRTGDHWDVVVDVARQPGHVRRAVAALVDRADHYVLVSTCNVYASQANDGQGEDAPRLAPLEADEMATPDEYGSAKVACEDAVLAAFGAQRTTIARAGLIGGPGDTSGRTTWWPWRFAHPAGADPAGSDGSGSDLTGSGTAVLVPDAPGLPTAVVDVRDLAAFLLLGAPGVFTVGGDPVPLPTHLGVARRVAGHTGPMVAAAESWLEAQGVEQWAGPRSLPLWLADRSWYGMNARSNARAVAAGLELRPLADTLRDSLVWEAEHGVTHPHGAGLTDDEERELLAAWGRRDRAQLHDAT